MNNANINHSADSVRRKQKFKNILSTIGEGLQEIFKDNILKSTGDKPNFISIDDVTSEEKGTSKSRVHFVTYSLNSDIGKHLVNVVVKFSSDEIRFEKEIRNHSKIADVSKIFSGVVVPKILYKSSQNKCIIYEGIDGMSFRDADLELEDKDILAGQALAAIHGIEVDSLDVAPYKRLILYLLSVLEDPKLEGEILDLMLPYFIALEKSKGATRIHGDFHQGNLLFSSKDIAALENKSNTSKLNVKVYVIDPEFIMEGRDRNEDIGTFFAKPCIKEFQKTNAIENTKTKFSLFLEGYNRVLEKIGAKYALNELYPEGLTIDFHVATYVLYDLADKILSKQMTTDSEEIKDRLVLLKTILREGPFQQ
ncbi:MAG: aminoglycoside phosphotransferase family protein [Candidatus Heimdallarchaeota archaeon]|nr:aminoglycoside phosphotransferase family protein [Candidatus Heimdallarchaeota archaeon]